MDSLPVSQGGNQNRAGSLMAVFWTEAPIAIIVVALRTYSRYKIKAIGLDDWMMIITLDSIENLLIIFCGSIPALKPLYDLRHENFKSSLSRFWSGKFSSGISSYTYNSDSAQKRSRRLHLEPYSENRLHRIDSEEHSLGVFAEAIGPNTRLDLRGNEDELSSLEMGRTNAERRWEVNSDTLPSL